MGLLLKAYEQWRYDQPLQTQNTYQDNMKSFAGKSIITRPSELSNLQK